MTDTRISLWLRGAAVAAIGLLAAFPVLPDDGAEGADIYRGYYSREGNDGDVARASRNSHYIRFYPGNRIVRLIIPFPYATTVQRGDIRRVFELAAGRTTGSAYISDTFGVLEERVVAQLDSVRVIEGAHYYDCGLSTPCRIEFSETGMTIVQKGLVKDHAITYELIPDPPE